MSRRCSTRGSERGHAQQLVVAAGLVRHPEHADGAALDEAAGEGRLVQNDQRVQRVAVLAEGVLDEAVVGRVAGRGEESTVQTDPTGLVVHLVLVPRTLRNLDGDVELHGWLLHDQHIVLVVKCPSRRCVIAKGAGGSAGTEGLASRETAYGAVRAHRETAPRTASTRAVATRCHEASRLSQLTAGAATLGLALAAGVVAAAGPWDPSGQRTAERDWAASRDREGGTDHGRNSGTASGTAPGMTRGRRPGPPRARPRC